MVLLQDDSNRSPRSCFVARRSECFLLRLPLGNFEQFVHVHCILLWCLRNIVRVFTRTKQNWIDEHTRRWPYFGIIWNLFYFYFGTNTLKVVLVLSNIPQTLLRSRLKRCAMSHKIYIKYNNNLLYVINWITGNLIILFIFNRSLIIMTSMLKSTSDLYIIKLLNTWNIYIHNSRNTCFNIKYYD